MDEHESLSHTPWDCKYHVVFIPKCRRKALYGELRRHLGEVFKKLAAQKESRIEEGHLMHQDNVPVAATPSWDLRGPASHGGGDTVRGESNRVVNRASADADGICGQTRLYCVIR